MERFRIRDTARRRLRRAPVPIPEELIVDHDGRAVAEYEGDRRTFDSLVDCLATHDLRGVDLDPTD